MKSEQQKMAVVIEGHPGSNQTLLLSGSDRIDVPHSACTHIMIVDAKTGKSPAHLKAKRAGHDLVVQYPDENGGQGELVLKDYYQDSPPLLGYNGDGALASWSVPDAASASSTFSDAAISNTAFVDTAQCSLPATVAAWTPAWLWALVGLGVAGLTAVALSGGGHGGDSESPPPSATPPVPEGYSDDEGGRSVHRQYCPHHR